MDKWKGKVALVTGASAGIGAAICKELVKNGLIVVGVARNAERIEKLANECPSENGGVLNAIKCDVTKDEEIYALFDEIKSKFGSLHICVNNAGLNYAKSLMDGSPKEWREILDVNVVALTLCTKLALAIMLERDDDFGHIINISSLSGHRFNFSHTGNFYTCSKVAVKVITEGFRREIRDMKKHIKITAVSPAFVRTEFLPRARGETGDMADMLSFEILEASDVAEAVIFALSTNSRVDINDVLLRSTENLN